MRVKKAVPARFCGEIGVVLVRNESTDLVVITRSKLNKVVPGSIERILFEIVSIEEVQRTSFD